MRVYPQGQILFNPMHGGLDILTHVQNVAALDHSHGETDGRLAVVAEQRGGRVFVATAHFGKIAQRYQPAIHVDAQLLDILNRFELAAYAHSYPIAGRFYDAGSTDGI